MKEMEYNGNIFLLPERGLRDAAVVTTNGIIKKDGKAVMGAGIAKYCRDTFPYVDKTLGDLLRDNGNHVYQLGLWKKPDCNGAFMLLSFPTKNDWRDASDLKLIQQSCKEIMVIAYEQNLNKVYMPCPGCTNGRLDYWNDVRPVLLDELDDRFIVCIPKHVMVFKDKRTV